MIQQQRIALVYKKNKKNSFIFVNFTNTKQKFDVVAESHSQHILRAPKQLNEVCELTWYHALHWD